MTHIEIYNNHFDFGPQDYRPCEITGDAGVDIHHIYGRILNEQLRSRKIAKPNNIWNLMSLCRAAHLYFGQKSEFNSWLWDVHQSFLEDQTPLKEKNPKDPHLLKFLLVYERNFRILRDKGDFFEIKEP